VLGARRLLRGRQIAWSGALIGGGLVGLVLALD
jgi:hypothetical protein